MTQTTERRCATCGEGVHPGDQFCGSCGAAVGAHAAADRPGTGSTSPAYPPPRVGLRILAGLAAFVVVAGISGLVVAFVDARRDVDDERGKLADAQGRIVELTNELDSTADPDATLQQQLAAAQADLEATLAQLTQTQADLTAERDGRAADAAAAQTQNADAVAAVQAELAAVQVQLAALQAIFPLDENTLRAAVPTGQYAVTIQPVECTIVACLELTTLSLSFPDATKVSGNRANGIIAFEDGSYVSSGTLATEQSPLCNGAATEATFALSFHASRVAVDNGVLAATQAIGTYRETVNSGECAGQFRAYSVSMVKQ